MISGYVCSKQAQQYLDQGLTFLAQIIARDLIERQGALSGYSGYHGILIEGGISGYSGVR